MWTTVLHAIIIDLETKINPKPSSTTVGRFYFYPKVSRTSVTHKK
jgi:hypothetical protein